MPFHSPATHWKSSGNSAASFLPGPWWPLPCPLPWALSLGRCLPVPGGFDEVLWVWTDVSPSVSVCF